MMEKFPQENSLNSMEGVPRQDIPLDFVEGESESVPIKKENEAQPRMVEFTTDMWQQYKELRLRSGETEPEAWGASIRAEPEKDELYWRQKLEDPHFKMFAIEMDGKIVAMCGLQQKSDGRFFGRRLYVAPEYRGKGLAKVLLDRVLDEAKSRGAKNIYLGVTDGLPALGLYKTMGFTEIGRHKDEMRGDGSVRDEIILEKKFE
ncbi:MAG: GNAT family N-acetyltransferase [bacterium]|nr:GNAT family N-acetyltransferase [bacterium]